MNERCFSRCFVIIPQISLHDISDIIKKTGARTCIFCSRTGFSHIFNDPDSASRPPPARSLPQSVHRRGCRWCKSRGSEVCPPLHLPYCGANHRFTRQSLPVRSRARDTSSILPLPKEYKHTDAPRDNRPFDIDPVCRTSCHSSYCVRI